MFLFVCSSGLTVATWVCVPIENTLFLENVNLADATFLKNILPKDFLAKPFDRNHEEENMSDPALPIPWTVIPFRFILLDIP